MMTEQNRTGFDPGRRFTFGRWPRDAQGTEAAPVEWTVLDVTDTAVLALSSRVIDAEAFDRPQSSRPWGGSEVRAWLNGRFAETAFTEEERQALLTTGTGNAHYDKAGRAETDETVRDRVFLLSEEECRRYLDVLWFGPDSLREKYSFRTRAPYTAYALARFRQQKGASWLFAPREDGSGKEPCAAWMLRTTRAASGPELQISFVDIYGSLCQTVSYHGDPMGIRPALRLDLSDSRLLSAVSFLPEGPAAETQPPRYHRIFPFTGRDPVRILEVPDPRHDNYNRFYVMWDRPLTDADGTLYRCAAAFSEAYDESECFNLYLIPESYDFAGIFSRETTVWSWPHTDDYEWLTDKSSRIAIWVSPDSGALAWQIDNALYYWHAPFVDAQSGRPAYVRMTASLPDGLDLSGLPADENGRVSFPSSPDCAWDIGKNLFVWRIGETEYFTDPETMFADGWKPDRCSLFFTRGREAPRLYVPPWTRVLESYPIERNGDGAYYPSVDTLLLPDGLETVEWGALTNFRWIGRLVIPPSVIMADGVDCDDVDISEVLILGDPERILRWPEDAFTGEPVSTAYREFRRKLSEGAPLPEKTDGGYLLR